MKTKKSVEHEISELVKLAETLKLPSGAFDDDVQDEARHEAKLIAEGVNESGLKNQLEYLYMRGWKPGRLYDLLREYAQSAPGGER